MTKILNDIREILGDRGSIATPLFRYLDTVGDGSGEKNANGDYSIAEEIFFLQPPPGRVYRITRLIVSIMDTSTATCRAR